MRNLSILLYIVVMLLISACGNDNKNLLDNESIKTSSRTMDFTSMSNVKKLEENQIDIDIHQPLFIGPDIVETTINFQLEDEREIAFCLKANGSNTALHVNQDKNEALSISNKTTCNNLLISSGTTSLKIENKDKKSIFIYNTKELKSDQSVIVVDANGCQNCTMSEFTLKSLDMEAMDFSGTVWRDGLFHNLNLSYADFSGASFQGDIDFIDSNLNDANFTNTNLVGEKHDQGEKIRFHNTQLSRISFINSNLQYISFHDITQSEDIDLSYVTMNHIYWDQGVVFKSPNIYASKLHAPDNKNNHFINESFECNTQEKLHECFSSVAINHDAVKKHIFKAPRSFKTTQQPEDFDGNLHDPWGENKNTNTVIEQYKFIADHAPLVYMAKDEKYYPSDIEYHLEHTVKAEYKKDAKVITKSIENFDDPNGDLEFFKGYSPNSGKRPMLYAFVLPVIGESFDAINTPQTAHIRVVYFYFYTFNRGKEVGGTTWGNHVGDIEKCYVEFNNSIPLNMNCAVHDFSSDLIWSEVKKVEGTNHPIVYSAEGSHGTYFTEGKHTYKDFNLVALTDYTDKGAPWHTWKKMEIVFPKDWNTTKQIKNKDNQTVDIGVYNEIYRWGNNEFGCCKRYTKDECRLNSGPAGFLGKGEIQDIIKGRDQEIMDNNIVKGIW